MSKRILAHVGLVVLLLLFAVATVYYVFSFRLGEPQVDIRKFNGSVLAVEGDTITIRGVFSGSVIIPEKFVSERDFSFRVSGDTEFRKADIRWPTWEELARQGTSGTFKIQDLPRTEVEGSLADLADLFSLIASRSVYMEAGFSSSIHNSKNPMASSVFYQLMGIPPPSPSPQPQNP